MNFAVDGRLIRTLADIGPRRLQRRLRYDLRQRLDRRLSPRIATAWAGGRSITPPMVVNPPELGTAGSAVTCFDCRPKRSHFDFLQQEKQLSWPIRWNDPNWPRLWQFHLHYFDWARDWLESALITDNGLIRRLCLSPLWTNGFKPIHLDVAMAGTATHCRCGPATGFWLVAVAQLATPGRVQSLWQYCVATGSP